MVPRRGRRRFKELVEYGYFTDIKLYRVVPGFITQWGIPGNPADYQKFGENKIKDDPVRQSNLTGTVTFATSGPDCRGSQIFVNVADNDGLDEQGFAPFGRLTSASMVQAFASCHDCSSYVKLDQSQAKQVGNAYFNDKAPKLSYIKSASIV